MAIWASVVLRCGREHTPHKPGEGSSPHVAGQLRRLCGGLSICTCAVNVGGIVDDHRELPRDAVRKPGPRFMMLTLGFSAGVMIHVSFIELLQGGVESVGFMSAPVAFFLGMLKMALSLWLLQ